MSARRAGDGQAAAAPGRAVDALAEDILPALIARLRASGLAELEVRHAGWRVRLRRDLRSQRRAARPAPAESSDGEAQEDAERAMARSPAVGYFSPGPALRVGSSVQTGDALGDIDVLGIAVEVTAPVSGLVSAVLVEAGQAVEYGQALAWIEALPDRLDDIGSDAPVEADAVEQEPVSDDGVRPSVPPAEVDR
jgi:acetyl-CoA carboxylase biotin carboxyl carrier protein